MSFTLCLPLDSGSLPGAVSGMTTVALLGVVGRMEIGQKFDFSRLPFSGFFEVRFGSAGDSCGPVNGTC